MSDIETVDRLIQDFIEEIPTLNNAVDLIEKYARIIDENADISNLKISLPESYHQYEDWLNELFAKEKVPGHIIAFNFGLYESNEGIQLYITGSSEWDMEDDDWACNNNYFPQNRYPDITFYKNLDILWERNFYLGLFLAISSSIFFANTYLISQPAKFPNRIVLATGFDDGDLYNFCIKKDENISTSFS